MLFSLSSPFDSPMDRAFRFFFASIWSKPKPPFPENRMAESSGSRQKCIRSSGALNFRAIARRAMESRCKSKWRSLREREEDICENLYTITRSTARDLHGNANGSRLQLLLSPIRWKSKLRTCSWGTDRIMTFCRGTFCGYYYHAHMVIQKTEASLCTRKYGGFVV